MAKEYPYVEILTIESAGFHIRADVALMLDGGTRLTLRGVRMFRYGETYMLKFPGVRTDGDPNHREAVTLPKPWRDLVMAAIVAEAGVLGYLAA